MIKVLVTGAGGQLGKSIQEIASSFPDLEIDFKGKDELNIVERESIFKLFSGKNYDYCINCAAFTQVDQAEQTPQLAYAVNATGVENLAIACLENEVKLIHISTDYVFDGENSRGYLPTDKPNPVNEYGKSKLAGEEIIKKTLKSYYIVRTSWLYSTKYGPNFYTTILKKAKEGEKLGITDQQKGCPTNAMHLANYLLALITENRTNYGIHHFTDGKVMSWFDFAKAILKQNNLYKSSEVVINNNYRSFAKRPANSMLLKGD